MNEEIKYQRDMIAHLSHLMENHVFKVSSAIGIPLLSLGVWWMASGNNELAGISILFGIFMIVFGVVTRLIFNGMDEAPEIANIVDMTAIRRAKKIDKTRAVSKISTIRERKKAS